jgi:hypothetical protein
MAPTTARSGDKRTSPLRGQASKTQAGKTQASKTQASKTQAGKIVVAAPRREPADETDSAASPDGGSGATAPLHGEVPRDTETRGENGRHSVRPRG